MGKVESSLRTLRGSCLFEHWSRGLVNSGFAKLPHHFSIPRIHLKWQFLVSRSISYFQRRVRGFWLVEGAKLLLNELLFVLLELLLLLRILELIGLVRSLHHCLHASMDGLHPLEHPLLPPEGSLLNCSLEAVRQFSLHIGLRYFNHSHPRLRNN